MNKLRPLALLCTGPVSRSPLTRLPLLKRNLVWVKSSSFRVASRAVNALGAGTPVIDLEEMKRALIWIVSVPPDELGPVLEELRIEPLDWRRRILLIFDSEAESDLAINIRAKGAAVASFAPIDNEEARYVVEGDSEAVRTVRLLIGDSHQRRVVELKKGAKRRFLAGARAATDKVLPLVAEAVNSFHTAGLTSSEAKAMTERLMTGAMRSYFRAGRRALKS